MCGCRLCSLNILQLVTGSASSRTRESWFDANEKHVCTQIFLYISSPEKSSTFHKASSKFSFCILFSPGIKHMFPIKTIWKMTSFCGEVLACPLPRLPVSLAGTDIVQTAGWNPPSLLFFEWLLWSDWTGADWHLQGLAQSTHRAAQSIHAKKSWRESNVRSCGLLSRWFRGSVAGSYLCPPPDWVTPSRPLCTSYNSLNAFDSFKRWLCCHGDPLAFKSHSKSNPSAEGEAKTVGEKNAWAGTSKAELSVGSCSISTPPSSSWNVFSGSGMKAFLKGEEQSLRKRPTSPVTVCCSYFRQ